MTAMFPILKSSERNKGFTLLEVIIAMAIMAVAFGAIIAVEAGSINASARAKQMNVVSMLAKNQMVETEFKIRNKSFDEIKKEQEGTFEAPFQDYKWKTVVKEMKFPKLAALSKGPGASDSNAGGSGTGGGGGQTDAADLISKFMTNFLSKAIREVTVSVSWKQGTKEQSFSLSTYWVNLNHEFSISE